MPTRRTIPPRMSGSTRAAEGDVAPGALADRAPELLGGLLVERDRAGDLDRERAVLLLPQPLVLLADAEEDGHAVVFDQQREEVHERRVGTFEHAAERRPASPWWRSRARRRRPRAGGCPTAPARTGRAARAARRACPARGRPRTASGRIHGRARPSVAARPEDRPDRSSSLRASSTSRRWSSLSSALRVTFSVAMMVRSATSRRRSSQGAFARHLDVAFGAFGGLGDELPAALLGLVSRGCRRPGGRAA